jgi:serine/threonine protein kinase/sugar lactone lactonase YvrE
MYSYDGSRPRDPSDSLMPVTTAETLLADLKRVPLLSPSQLRRVEEAATRGSHSPQRVIGRLVEKGWVTRFQGDTILAGRADTLLVGPYQLLDLLGEGGMGRVYKARHTRLGRVDAVKVLRADKLASQTLARRFAREIRLTASLEHTHIVRALDAGEFGGRLFLATEYIDGEDLATTVTRSGPLSAADACLAAYQTCLALQYVHDRGLVHRDVKPSNLMRERKTRAAKLMDLGLSGVRAGDAAASLVGTALTADGMMLGTPDFMSPEQARNPHGADIRADLYGLGTTLFFLLTGHPPYAGSAIEKLLAHASSPIPPVVTPTGPAPAALAAVVTRLMAKRPDDRYPAPAAVAEALLSLRPTARPPAALTLTDAAAPQSQDAPPVASPEQWQSEFEELVDRAESQVIPAAPLPPRRGRLVWLLPTVAALLAVGLFGVAAVVDRSRTPNDPIPVGPLGVRPPPAAPSAAEELRELRVAVTSTAEDRDAVRRRVIDFRAKYSGTAHATAAAALLRRLPSPLDRLTTAGGPFVRVAGLGPTVGTMAFSADDTRFVIARAGQAPEELNVPDLVPTNRFASAGAVKSAAALAPDGRVAVAVDARGRLVVWGAAGPRTLEMAGQPARAVGLAPDGKTAVVVPDHGDAALTRIDLLTGKALGQVDVRAVGVREVIVANDGSTCLVTADDGTARVVSLTGSKSVRTIEPYADVTGPPLGAFAPDGGRMYLAGIEHEAGRFPAGADRSDLRYEIGTDRGVGLLRFLTRTQRPTAVAVAADEATVAVGASSGRLVVFAAATGKPTGEFTLPGGVRALAFSTHGRVLAAAMDGGRVVLIPLGK